MSDFAAGIEVRRATIEDLDVVAELFDGYRVFYDQESEPSRARRFIRNRLEQKDSVIFVALADDRVAGFVQMYPSFSSVATARVWILNDLFVDTESRRRGVGRALVDHAVVWARRQGAAKLVLETAVDNESAKSLYELLGWKRQTGYDVYEFLLE